MKNKNGKITNKVEEKLRDYDTGKIFEQK